MTNLRERQYKSALAECQPSRPDYVHPERSEQYGQKTTLADYETDNVLRLYANDNTATDICEILYPDLFVDLYDKHNKNGIFEIEKRDRRIHRIQAIINKHKRDSA